MRGFVMFGKDELSLKGDTSILAKDIFVKGNITSDSVLEIQGKVEGDINGNIITLREEGYVAGNIYAKILNIKGRFSGIARSEKINVAKKGDTKGTLEYETLCVEDGACIEGELKRVTINKSDKKEEKKSSTTEKEDIKNKTK